MPTSAWTSPARRSSFQFRHEAGALAIAKAQRVSVNGEHCRHGAGTAGSELERPRLGQRALPLGEPFVLDPQAGQRLLEQRLRRSRRKFLDRQHDVRDAPVELGRQDRGSRRDEPELDQPVSNALGRQQFHRFGHRMWPNRWPCGSRRRRRRCRGSCSRSGRSAGSSRGRAPTRGRAPARRAMKRCQETPPPRSPSSQKLRCRAPRICRVTDRVRPRRYRDQSPRRSGARSA